MDLQRSQAWFDARAGKMTASKMAEAVGLVGSRRRLWRELTGRERPQATNARMQDGIDYEQIAVAQYEQVMGCSVVQSGFLLHPQHDWIGGSPDGLVHAIGGVEVKCPAAQYGRVPDYYLPQMQGLLEITNRDWWDFAVWTPDAMAITRVYRSTEYWSQLHELLCEFWAYVESDTEPPAFKRGCKPRITAVVETRLLHRE